MPDPAGLQTEADLASLPIKVIVHDDSDDVTFEWDETHPMAIELGLADWSEDDWIEAIEAGLPELEDEEA